MHKLEVMETKVISEETLANNISNQIKDIKSLIQEAIQTPSKINQKRKEKKHWVEYSKPTKNKRQREKIKEVRGRKTHWIQMNSYVNDSWGLSKNDVRHIRVTSLNTKKE